jgi:MarR family transcriptional regulator, organic hydroperoxide resistance regulator
MRRQREGGFLISKIHQLSGRIFSRMLKEHGINEINPAQGRIMFILWREDNIPISDLAVKTSLGKSTLTSMLDRLEHAGFIERIAAADDRRTLLIRRTAKDREFQDLYVEVSRKMGDIFYREFTRKDIDQFEGFLRRIFANLSDYENEMA